MRSRRRFGSSRSGGAAVEFVVMFPILLLLIIGAVDYGRAFYTAVTVSNAARAGAEYGARDLALTGDTVSMKNFAQADGQEAGTLTLSARRYCECGAGVANACTACGGGAAPDVYIEVTASKSLSMFFPYPGLPSTVFITRTATFRNQ